MMQAQTLAAPLRVAAAPGGRAGNSKKANRS
jgi:hypothetical protein